MIPPSVSVVTTVCDGELFLAQAIESVLGQSFTDFEYLIVDDASTDSSAEIMHTYAAQDSRIVVMRNNSRLGPSGTLNRALHAARGMFLANLDQDDLAMPERLALQTAFLKCQPSVGVVGSYVRWLDADGQVTASIRYPVVPRQIRWELLFRGCVVHSAAMMRRDLLLRSGGYSLDHPYACDYELWTRLIQTTEFANIAEYLAAYRITEGQTSRTQRKSQQGQIVLLMHAALFRTLGVRIPLQQVNNLYWGIRQRTFSNEAEVSQTAELLGNIMHMYLEKVSPDTATVTTVRESCAVKMFRLAWHHRELSSGLYDRLLEKAVQFDARLLSNSEVTELLGADHDSGCGSHSLRQ